MSVLFVPRAPEAQPNRSRAPLHPGRPTGERQRELLLGLVSSNPGLHVLRAAYLLGLNWNTCLHHVRRLEGERRIVVRKVGGRLCLFDRREGAVAPRLAPLLLREGRNAEIARIILEKPGMNQKGMAAALGMAASVVHRRLLRFEEAGLVQRVARSRSVTVFPTRALEAAWKAPGLVPVFLHGADGMAPEAAPDGALAPDAPLPFSAPQPDLLPLAETPIVDGA